MAAGDFNPHDRPIRGFPDVQSAFERIGRELVGLVRSRGEATETGTPQHFRPRVNDMWVELDPATGNFWLKICTNTNPIGGVKVQVQRW